MSPLWEPPVDLQMQNRTAAAQIAKQTEGSANPREEKDVAADLKRKQSDLPSSDPKRARIEMADSLDKSKMAHAVPSMSETVRNNTAKSKDQLRGRAIGKADDKRMKELLGMPKNRDLQFGAF
ncbi:hypothetical protein BJ742DRAFT_744940 [Cladochytrium replicatum]|nr:hypothetical protein BJ742DRAFT_744940 [Cladochytrium replicatum]